MEKGTITLENSRACSFLKHKTKLTKHATVTILGIQRKEDLNSQNILYSMLSAALLLIVLQT